jgi:hypothetical protein
MKSEPVERLTQSRSATGISNQLIACLMVGPVQRYRATAYGRGSGDALERLRLPPRPTRPATARTRPCACQTVP